MASRVRSIGLNVVVLRQRRVDTAALSLDRLPSVGRPGRVHGADVSYVMARVAAFTGLAVGQRALAGIGS